MIVNVIQDLEKRMETNWEDAGNVYKRPTRTTEQINEMNNTPEGIHSRITEAEAQINDLEDRMVEMTATEQNTEKRKYIWNIQYLMNIEI